MSRLLNMEESNSQDWKNPEAVLDVAIPLDGLERNEDIKEVVRVIVGGAWHNVPSDQFSITTISGGITNILFLVSCLNNIDISPVLVRLYGANTEILIDRERENRIFAELSLKEFAPIYFGRFKTGRVEGYLPARSLEPHEMGENSPVDFQRLIAQEVAKLHNLDVLCCSRQPVLWNFIFHWLELATEINFPESEIKSKKLADIELPRVIEEAKWLQNALLLDAQSGSQVGQFFHQVILGHQDLLSGNILYNNTWDRVQIIDFEYGGYNYRGFDIANHFCEYAGFSSDFENDFPNKSKQLYFIQKYVEAVSPELFLQLQTENQLKNFLDEAYILINHFTCASHLFWGSWAIIQARYSPIDFDFLNYSRVRLNGYWMHKREFFGYNCL